MHVQLQELGLTEKEALAYQVLVKYGSHPTSFIAKKAELNRGTTYTVLHDLLEKGFATKSTKGNVQYFSPLQPEKIRFLLETRKDDIQRQIDHVDPLIEQLTKLTGASISKPRVQYYAGQEGARVAMLDTLVAEEEALRSFLSIHDVGDFLGAEFFEEYTNKRIATGPFLRAIRNQSKDERAFATNPYAKKYLTSEKDRREVRYLGKPIEFPMSIYLYDHCVLGLSSKQEGFAVVLQSQDLSLMLKSLFDVFWEGLKQV